MSPSVPGTARRVIERSELAQTVSTRQPQPWSKPNSLPRFRSSAVIDRRGQLANIFQTAEQWGAQTGRDRQHARLAVRAVRHWLVRCAAARSGLGQHRWQRTAAANYSDPASCRHGRIRLGPRQVALRRRNHPSHTSTEDPSSPTCATSRSSRSISHRMKITSSRVRL